MANMVWSYAKANWDAIEASEKFKAAGIQESRLDQQAQDKLEELCIKYMELESGKNPDYAKIAKSIVDYLKRFDKVRDIEGRFKSGTALKTYPEIK
jgi:hypothetical protein